MRSINIIFILLFSLPIFSDEILLTVESMRKSSFPDSKIVKESVFDDNNNYKAEDISFSINGIKQYALMSTPKLTPPKKRLSCNNFSSWLYSFGKVFYL